MCSSSSIRFSCEGAGRSSVAARARVTCASSSRSSSTIESGKQSSGVPVSRIYPCNPSERRIQARNEAPSKSTAVRANRNGMTQPADFERLGSFYLGRLLGPDGSVGPEPLLLDAKDLTTHAVCLGMTGSGKTGLCVSLLEEAAIDGV